MSCVGLRHMPSILLYNKLGVCESPSITLQKKSPLLHCAVYVKTASLRDCLTKPLKWRARRTPPGGLSIGDLWSLPLWGKGRIRLPRFPDPPIGGTHEEGCPSLGLQSPGRAHARAFKWIIFYADFRWIIFHVGVTGILPGWAANVFTTAYGVWFQDPR
jgi:hypothetical protein